MKKSVFIITSVLVLVVFLSLSFVSAGWFSNLITGNAVVDKTLYQSASALCKPVDKKNPSLQVSVSVKTENCLRINKINSALNSLCIKGVDKTSIKYGDSCTQTTEGVVIAEGATGIKIADTARHTPHGGSCSNHKDSSTCALDINCYWDSVYSVCRSKH